MKTLLALLLSVFLFFNLNVSAQDDFSFGAHALLSIPVGDFGDDSGEGAGFAKTGFGIGADFTLPIGAPGLGWTSSLSFIINPQDKNAIKDLLIDAMGMPEDASISTKSTLNIPILTGLKYQTEVANDIELYGAFLFGLNFIKPGEWKGTVEGESGSIEFDSATSLGFAIAGGVIFNEHLNAGFKYFGLGEPDLDATLTSPDPDLNGTETVEQKITIFAITVGYSF